MKRLITTVFLLTSALALGCEECSTSKDCSPGWVCIDAICEKQVINDNDNCIQKCDEGTQQPPSIGGYSEQTSGGGCGNDDDDDPPP